jgi:hypothetical protein
MLADSCRGSFTAERNLVVTTLFYKRGQFFNALVVLPNASRFRWILLYISGVLRLTPAYLVYKSPTIITN